MTIDTADLPAPVQRAVHGLAAAPNDHAAAALRSYAASSYQAISGIWHTRQWHQVHEHLALMAGFLTAATRLEEEEGTA